jgi:nitrogen fixation/metabolism regulation signal transduction histidine kinase
MTQQMPLQEPQQPDTHFAPPRRAADQELEALATRALSDPILTVVFEAVGGLAMVLNVHRQILAANEELLTMLNVKTGASILGLRPGEVIKCVNASRGPNGCGTSRQCQHCGAVTALLAAQVADHPIDGQCTITRWDQDCPKLVDFRVRVRPLDWNGERVYVVVFQDITAVKWRELQSQLFLHDLANVVTGLAGWSSMLIDESSSEVAASIVEMVQRLTDSLHSHQLLLQCEAGELRLTPTPILADELTSHLQVWFKPIAKDKRCNFVIARKQEHLNLVTDAPLLLRVIGNLVTNALEASHPGETVTLTILTRTDHTVFAVHNPGVIAEDAANQLFKTRFSTKGHGRGLGMYTVQVFGEQYLGGHVDFETSDEHGTVFRFAVPNAPAVGQA